MCYRPLRLALAMPLRAKIMAIVFGMVLVVGVVVVREVRITILHTMRQELQHRGVSVGQEVAGRAGDLMLTDNLFALEELLRDRMENDEEVRYLLVLDAAGLPAAHTFGPGLPAGLLAANSLPPQARSHAEVLETEEGLIHDVAVPVLEGRLGAVRVGMSERRLQQVVASTTWGISLVVLAVSLLATAAAYWLTSLVTRPVLELARVAGAVGRGDLDQRVSVRTSDEAGELAGTFNQMIESLRRSREEAAQSQRRLVRRNKELSRMNALATTVSRSLQIQEILDGALEKLLEDGRYKAGWVVFWDPQHERLELAAAQGLSQAFAEFEAEKPLDGCVCREVLETGQVRIVHQMDQCPYLKPALLEREGLCCHASVPLKAMDQVVGVLNLASAEPRTFNAEDESLLLAIGHQIALAVENARLFREVSQKEGLQRYLLDRLISAQEEERRKVARELHDQVGQGLTALIMALGGMEETMPTNAWDARCRLAELRNLLESVVQDTRDVMSDLRPALLDDLGLLPALRSYAERHLGRGGVRFTVRAQGPEQPLQPPLAVVLLRVAQEAITNILKYAEASQVDIELEFKQDSVRLSVTDNGKGFDFQAVQADRRGFGLLGMQERAELAGGELRIASRPGQGARVEVHLPLPNPRKG